VPFIKNKSGVLEVDLKINGYSKRFIYDTGASAISFGQSFFDELLNNGFISNSDIKYKTKTSLADGSLATVTAVNIKKLQLGDFELTNVEALVMDVPNAPMLAGQTVFERFGTVTLDNNKKKLFFTENLNQLCILQRLKYVPCTDQQMTEVDQIKHAIGADAHFNIGKVDVETNFPIPDKALKGIAKKITIRYFDGNDKTAGQQLRSKLLNSGYTDQDIFVEDMAPRYAMGILSSYIEIWIK